MLETVLDPENTKMSKMPSLYREFIVMVNIQSNAMRERPIEVYMIARSKFVSCFCHLEMRMREKRCTLFRLKINV